MGPSVVYASGLAPLSCMLRARDPTRFISSQTPTAHCPPPVRDVKTQPCRTKPCPQPQCGSLSKKRSSGGHPAYFIHSIVQRPNGASYASAAKALNAASEVLVNSTAPALHAPSRLLTRRVVSTLLHRSACCEPWSASPKARGASSAGKGKLVSRRIPLPRRLVLTLARVR